MKILDQACLDRLLGDAEASARRRKNFNLHEQLSDPVQRLCNALMPDSYVRPHRHLDPPRWELFTILRGTAVVLTFDDHGRVAERVELHAGGPAFGLEIPAGAWHTVAALAGAAVVFEVKEGPYAALTDKDFAQWAPPEGHGHCGAFRDWYGTAQPGDMPPSRK